jgi:hypothetical protein
VLESMEIPVARVSFQKKFNPDKKLVEDQIVSMLCTHGYSLKKIAEATRASITCTYQRVKAFVRAFNAENATDDQMRAYEVVLSKKR